MSCRVLLVEDDPTEREMLEKLLKENGYQTLSVKDGVEAVRVVSDHKPDVIVMDFIMPEINGIETLQEIRKKADLIHIPVILTSTFNNEHFKREYSKISNLSFLEKPYKFDALKRIIDSVPVH